MPSFPLRMESLPFRKYCVSSLCSQLKLAGVASKQSQKDDSSHKVCLIFGAPSSMTYGIPKFGYKKKLYESMEEKEMAYSKWRTAIVEGCHVPSHWVWMRIIMSPILLLGEMAVNVFLHLHAYLGVLPALKLIGYQ